MPDAQTGLFRKAFSFPFGLFGFESVQMFSLSSEPDEAPFLRLQVQDNASLEFVVISPFEVLKDYHPEIPRSDLEFLNLDARDDMLLLSIVKPHAKGVVTANLKGPIVINRQTAKAKQVILENAARYSLVHPLSVTES